MKEALRLEKDEFQAAPTQLKLFRFNSNESERISALISRGSKISRGRDISSEDIEKKGEEIGALVKKFEQAEIENLRVAMQYASHRTISAAYLKILDELGDRLPIQALNEFFIKCFEANSEFHSEYSNKENHNASKMMVLSDRKSGKYLSFVLRKAGTAPKWFWGNKSSWRLFFEAHSNFHVLLEENKMTAYDVRKRKLGFTNSAWIPDWMDDMSKGVTREKVEKELREDTEEQNSAIEYSDKIFEKKKRVLDIHRRKHLKAICRYETERRNFIPKNASFAEFIVYLSLFENFTEYPEVSDGESNTDYLAITKNFLKPRESREKSIKQYFEQNGFPQEIISLWLEKKFKEAGFSTSDMLEDSDIQKINLFDRRKREELAALRATDKKLFAIYNYDLKPLFNFLENEEIDYLSELIENSQGERLESVIWEMSYIFSNKLAKQNDSEKERVVNELKKFSTSWIKDNWKYAYHELEKAIRTPQQNSEDFETLTNNANGDEDELVKEYSILEESIEQGNLIDWNIFYTTNMRVQAGGDLIKINGETLSSKQEELEKILVRKGDQISIKNSSIMNALDWITTIPEDILGKWPTKEVNGEIFKKFKRGAVRILAQVDQEHKQIAFFLHQKKAWSYGF